MKYAKRMLMVAGAVALAGILGVAITPKAAHGIVAAMVQVVNSSSSPVAVTTATNPGNSVTLECVSPSGFEGVCTPLDYGELNSDGSIRGTPYTVPAGQVFVITDVEWSVSGGAAGESSAVYLTTQTSPGEPGTIGFPTAPFLYIGGGNAIATKGPTVHTDHFTTGIVTTSVPFAEALDNDYDQSITHVILRGYTVAQ